MGSFEKKLEDTEHDVMIYYCGEGDTISAAVSLYTGKQCRTTYKQLTVKKRMTNRARLQTLN